MTEELGKEELIDRLDTMLIGACADSDQHEPSQIAEEGKEKIREAYRHLIQNPKPKVSINNIRKTARYIVMEIFNREYNFDNSQTQRAIIEMLIEAGVEVVPEGGRDEKKD